MRIETRFAWIIAICFLFGVTVSGLISYRLETRQSYEEVKQKASLLLEAAVSVRTYTSDEVAPFLMTSNNADFHAAQIPSFAAQSTLRRLAEKFPDYRYRESSLNPTNVHDRASDWEVGLLRAFQSDEKLTELFGEFGKGDQASFYAARPIRVKSAACLVCHSTPDIAPKGMIEKYGSVNGFGWKLGDVVGMQLMEVPKAPTDRKAFNSVLMTVGSLTCVFILAACIFLILLRRYVTTPLEMLTRVAHATSISQEIPETPEAGFESHQFSQLHAAIVRLQASMTHAVKLFERNGDNSSPNDKV